MFSEAAGVSAPKKIVPLDAQNSYMKKTEMQRERGGSHINNIGDRTVS